MSNSKQKADLLDWDALPSAEDDTLDWDALPAADTDPQLDTAMGQAVKARQAPGNPAQAALEGFGQTATMGYLPRIQAAVEPAQSAVTGGIRKLLGGAPAPETPDYEQRLIENAQRQQRLEQTDPMASAAGKAAGIVSTAIPAARGAAGLGKLGSFLKGLGPTAQGAAAGAVGGAAYDPGTMETFSGEGMKQRGLQALIGAATGGAGGAIGGRLGRAGDRSRMISQIKKGTLQPEIRKKVAQAGDDILYTPEQEELLRSVAKSPIDRMKSIEVGSDAAEGLLNIQKESGVPLATMSEDVTAATRNMFPRGAEHFAHPLEFLKSMYKLGKRGVGRGARMTGAKTTAPTLGEALGLAVAEKRR